MANEDEIHDEYGSVDLAVTRNDPMGTLVEPMYSGVLSYMRRKYTKDLTDVDIAVLGVPFDLSVGNRPGTRFGPRAIRAASSMMAWDRAYGWPFDPFEVLRVIDYGDCVFDPGRPEMIPQLIENQFDAIAARGVTTLAFGGDHFTAYPSLKAHAKIHGPLSLIQFDAHSDTWRDSGDRIDHGTMFFRAVQEGVIRPATSIQVGIRSNNDETHGIKILDADWVAENGPKATADAIRERVGDTACYITFDIDCLDPSFAPGTGTPVAGGLQTREARSILRKLAGIDLRAMDLVEVSPPYDSGEITALAGATIALDLLCLFAARKLDTPA